MLKLKIVENTEGRNQYIIEKGDNQTVMVSDQNVKATRIQYSFQKSQWLVVCIAVIAFIVLNIACNNYKETLKEQMDYTYHHLSNARNEYNSYMADMREEVNKSDNPLLEATKKAQENEEEISEYKYHVNSGEYALEQYQNEYRDFESSQTIYNILIVLVVGILLILTIRREIVICYPNGTIRVPFSFKDAKNAKYITNWMSNNFHINTL